MSTRQLAWRTALAGARAVGRPTSALRPLPDFLIVGAQRCATTSLHHYLLQHRAVLGPRLTKGVHWFDTGYQRPLAWYRSNFPTTGRRAALESQLGIRAVVGESSPYYLFHPDAPGRIRQVLPAAKLLVILRDPVQRAWSHYHHEVERGFESLTFEEALAAEDERLGDPFGHQHHSYAARGHYLDQLERLWQLFPRPQVLVLLNEDLAADPGALLAEAHRFLGVPHQAPVVARRWNERRKPPMPEGARSALTARFAEPNRRLAEALGRSLPWAS